MKSLWLILIVLNAMQTGTESSDAFGYELITAALETMQTSIKALEEDLRSVNTRMNQMDTYLRQLVVLDAPRCTKNAGNGVISLRYSQNDSFSVYCEEGWIVIHRRFDGQLNFNRLWNEYRNGFGEVTGEHWLGLEKMHQITRGGSYELMVILKSHDDVEKRAKYAGFEIASEADQYRLYVDKFSFGDAGDSLKFHNTMQFSTSDRDNEKHDENCAVMYKGGWWFHKCYQSNLNGVFKKGQVGMNWWTFDNSWESLKEARMMIRPTKLKCE